MTQAKTVKIAPQDLSHAEGLYAALRDPRIYAFLDDAPPESLQSLHARMARLAKGAPEGSGQIWLNWTVFEGEVVVGYTQATIEADGTARAAYVFSPGIWWIGSRMNLSGSEVQILQMYSYGVRPFRVFSLRA